MNKNFKILLIILPTVLLGAYIYFKNYSFEGVSKKQIERTKISNDSVLSTNEKFVEDSILKNKFDIELGNYIKHDKKCPVLKYKKKDLIDEFESFQNIGDIDKDGKEDYVFVLRPLNFCEEGQSYYFSNSNIPRIYTTSYCCHPKSIFSIGDIDEDGSNEIAQYYSSCASRYKHFNIWTLKNLKWIKITEIPFTINNDYKEFSDFSKLYKKIKKNNFQFLEISDVKSNGEIVKKWKIIEMN